MGYGWVSKAPGQLKVVVFGKELLRAMRSSLGGWMSFKVNKGDMVRFWKDRWCGWDPLAREFPEVFSIGGLKTVISYRMARPISDLGGV